MSFLSSNKSLLSITHEIEENLPRFMKEVNVPGLAMTLINDHKLFWSKSFGYANAETKEPIGSDTLFEAASLSKPVLAYRALQLCDKGQLDLDKPLNDYISEPILTDDPQIGLITMRHVLCHTTGFPNWRKKGTPLRIMLPPGERFSYSGEGYLYLQKVLEKVTGQSALKYISFVLNACEMVNSNFIWTGKEKCSIAVGHNRVGIPVKKEIWSKMRSSSSLHTTSTEYAQFMCTVMQPSYEDYHLSPEMTSEMINPHVQVNDNAPWHRHWPKLSVVTDDLVSWGLGWGLQRTSQGHSFWHWGDNEQYHSLAMGLPGTGQGVVVLTNGANGQQLIMRLMDEIFEGTYPCISWLKRIYSKS